MPRPLKFLNTFNCRANIPEKYLTRSGEIPPSAAVPLSVQDEGNCGPKFMRSTVMNAPLEQSMQNTSQIPFGFIVQPFAEPYPHEYEEELQGQIPYVDYGDEGPFRCYRCKGYVNPFMEFVDGGTKAQCNLC